MGPGAYMGQGNPGINQIREHFKPGASLVLQGITKSQHQVIWWLVLTHENCPAHGLKWSPKLAC